MQKTHFQRCNNVHTITLECGASVVIHFDKYAEDIHGLHIYNNREKKTYRLYRLQHGTAIYEHHTVAAPTRQECIHILNHASESKTPYCIAVDLIIRRVWKLSMLIDNHYHLTQTHELHCDLKSKDDKKCSLL